jgi:hypothetical protein
MKALLTIAYILLFHSVALSQVHSDRRIELVGNDPATRQVLGLRVDQSGNAALSTQVEQAGQYRFAVASVQDGWEIELASLTIAPEAGTHLLVKVPSGASGNAQLSVNSLGPFPVMVDPNTPLEASDVPEGTVLSLVFDGTLFHVMNGAVHARQPCPEGMVQASQQFCIDINESGPETFYQAALRCGEVGKRLCTWTEFYQGCIRSGTLGLQDMTGNHEWADTAMNEDNYAQVVGRLSCTTAGGLNAADWQEHFRCCYTR